MTPPGALLLLLLLADLLLPSWLSQKVERDAAELAAAYRALHTVALCEDQVKECVEWADAGECEKNKGFMSQKCRHACHLCGQADGGKVNLQHPTAAHTVTGCRAPSARQSIASSGKATCCWCYGWAPTNELVWRRA